MLGFGHRGLFFAGHHQYKILLVEFHLENTAVVDSSLS